MIFRLRGVALFEDQFVAYQPNGNGRNGQTIWLSLAALGGCWTDILIGGAGGVDRTAKRSHAHCKFILVAPVPSILFKNVSSKSGVGSKSLHAQTARSLSNHACILERSTRAFNRSGRLYTGSKVDRLG